MDEKITNAVSALREDHDQHGVLLDEQEERLVKLERLVGSLCSRIDIAESTARPPREFLDEAEDNRSPLDHVLRINSEAVTGKNLVESAFSKLLADAGVVDGKCTISGPSAGKYFKIAFIDNNVGAPRARNIFNFMRNDGDWREIYADVPQSAAQGLGSKVRIYIGADKSPRAKRVEMATRKALLAVREIYPDKRFSARRSEGIIYVDGTLITARSPAPGKFNLVQNPSQIRAHSLDFQRIKARFSKFFVDRDFAEVPWSS